MIDISDDATQALVLTSRLGDPRQLEGLPTGPAPTAAPPALP